MLFSIAALLLTSVFVGAAPTRPLPIKRGTNQDPSIPTSYIVALNPNTVDPSARGPWLDKIFTAAGASLSDDEKSALRLGWNETVFNGLGGVFNSDALNVLRAHENVQYIQESTLTSEAYAFPLSGTFLC